MKRISFLLVIVFATDWLCQKQTIATDKATYDGSLWAKRLYYLHGYKALITICITRITTLRSFDSKGTQVGGIDLQKLSQTYSLKGNPTISYIDANQVVIEEGISFTFMTMS